MDDNNVTISGRNIWHNYPHKMSDNLKSVIANILPTRSNIQTMIVVWYLQKCIHNGFMARPVIVFITIKKRQTFLISN